MAGEPTQLRALAAWALVAGLFASAMVGLPSAGAAHQGQSATTVGHQTDCLTPPGAVLCVRLHVTATVDCGWVDRTSRQAACTGTSELSYQAGSPVAPGGSAWEGADQLSFCPPGGACQGLGTGFPRTTCSWEALSPGCSGTLDASHGTGTWTLDPGQCLQATLTTAGQARAYTPDEQTMGPRLAPTAEVDVDATAEVCA